MVSKVKRNQLNPDEMFAYYIQLGNGKRSYQKVADHFKCSKSRVDEIGSREKWVEKSEKFDNEVQDEVIEKIKEQEVNTRVLLDTANQESILTYMRMIKDKDSISVEQAKVLDILGRLWKELETQVETVNSQPLGVNENSLQVDINIVEAGGDYED